MTTEAAETPQMRRITIEIPVHVAQKMAESYEGTLEDATLAGLKLIHGMGKPTYTKLQSLAKLRELAVSRVLRDAINLQEEHLAKSMNTTPAALGRPKINAARDEAIFKQVSNGQTYAAVASAFSISLVRVGQIVAQQRAMMGVSLREKLAERNAEIIRRVECGEHRQDVAASYGVTRSVVDNVMSLHRAANPKAIPEMPEPGSFKVKSPEVAPEPAPPTQPTTEPTPTPTPKKLFLPGLMKRHPDDQPAEVVEDTRTAIERNVVDPEFGF